MADVDRVYQYLKENRISVTRYYARLGSKTKDKNIDAFMNGKKHVMVCTNALGMGIDKSDIRFVIHCNMPLCLENYYQEAGRAGRDGQAAECILYYSESDYGICCQQIETSLAGSGLSENDRGILSKVDYFRLNRMKDYAKRGPSLSSDELKNYVQAYFREDPYEVLSKQDEQIRKDSLDVLSCLDRVDVLYVNRTKVANELRKGKMSGTELVVGRSKKKSEDGTESDQKQPTVSYSVTKAELTYFDLMVADAVYTLMFNRVPVIYARAVWELLSGQPGLLLRRERTEAVNNSIRKMMNAAIRIDRTKSCGYGFAYRGEDKIVLEGEFLRLEEKETGGFVYDAGYVPPLYEYAEILNGQFYTFPTKYLRVGKPTVPEEAVSEAPDSAEDKKKPRSPVKNIYTSAENLAMTHYLLCRVHMVSQFDENYAEKKKNKTLRAAVSCRVRFDTMLNVLKPGGRLSRARGDNAMWTNRVIPIFRHFQAVGLISSFEADPKKKIVEIQRYKNPDRTDDPNRTDE